MSTEVQNPPAELEAMEGMMNIAMSAATILFAAFLAYVAIRFLFGGGFILTDLILERLEARDRAAHRELQAQSEMNRLNEYAERQAAREEAERETEKQRRRGQIMAAGVMDVMTAWYVWAADANAREQRRDLALKDRARELIRDGMDADSAGKTAWHEDTVRRSQAVQDMATLTAKVPDDTWTVGQLQDHAYAVLEAVTLAGDKTSGHEHLCLVSALIADRRDDLFDVEAAPFTETYAYSEDRETQALYLQGRGMAIDQILDAHTAARTHLGRTRAAREAIAAANERHTTALRGIRETYQPTHHRDALTDWDRQAQAIEGNTTP